MIYQEITRNHQEPLRIKFYFKVNFAPRSDCTFFTKKEIIRLHSRFRELAPETVPLNMQSDQAMILTLAPDLVAKMTELKENPFAERILQVFSEDDTGQGSG